MSKAEAAVADPEEVDPHAPTDPENPENPDPEHKPAEGADLDGGGEGGAPGEGGQPGEGKPKPKEGDVDPRDQEIADLRAKIEEIEKGIKSPKEDAPQPTVYTEEQKAKIEENFGGMPFAQVEAVGRLIANAVSQITAQIEGRFSKSDKSSVIAELAKTKEYADIGTYTQAIDEYLKKFSPTLHGNKDFIIDALYWAKGKGLKNTVRKAVSSGERNKHIAGAARPAAPGGGDGNKNKVFQFKLTGTEEAAYASFGRHKFPTKEAYARSLARYKNAAK